MFRVAPENGMSPLSSPRAGSARRIGPGLGPAALSMLGASLTSSSAYLAISGVFSITFSPVNCWKIDSRPV
jgi:hypothetical protein